MMSSAHLARSDGVSGLSTHITAVQVVQELEPNSKSTREIQALYRYIVKEMGSNVKEKKKLSDVISEKKEKRKQLRMKTQPLWKGHSARIHRLRAEVKSR